MLPERDCMCASRLSKRSGRICIQRGVDTDLDRTKTFFDGTICAFGVDEPWRLTHVLFCLPQV